MIRIFVYLFDSKTFTLMCLPLCIRRSFALAVIVCFVSCNDSNRSESSAKTDSLSEQEKHLPENALKGLEIAEGLEVTAMATEPMLKNPTNIDVDERGRVWVTEAYNYRPDINGNPVNEKGDRIVILEDNNGDGKMDTAKVFYQAPDLNAPLGVCVLGKRVIVSQSPYIWSFYDDNGDDKADRKEIMFQGIGGVQHDHGAHSFTFGPDGKLYFNFGNEGKTLRDKNGRPVRDQDGDEIGPKKYKQGMVFRCNPDGTNVECLGQNFRNNYEVAVDSYGTMWQSDNDDDGNRGVRINYVLEYGNYGFTDEMTGAGWQANRTNVEDSIPFKHWHLNDPGVVPNLLQTGAGSPTGMVIYEAALLPQKFHNQMIHCDPGPNVVRSYPVAKKGAGYTASIENILRNEKDQWFRPADICIAPDGSLIIADWYDPGVGGHAAGDQQRGRIYRVAPRGSAYKIPTYDYSTPQAAVLALQNPNLAVRHHAWTALQKMGASATPALENIWKHAQNDRMKARAFWVLVKTVRSPETYIQQAVSHANPDIRIMGIRAATQLNKNVIPIIDSLSRDADPQVRRACAVALHHRKDKQSPAIWTTLALQYDGSDRWYLEALGIAAADQWNSFVPVWLDSVGDPLKSKATRDIVWRARTDRTVPYLARLAADSSVALKERLRYFRAFDFNTGPAKSGLLLSMIRPDAAEATEFNKLVLRHLDKQSVVSSPKAMTALTSVVRSLKGTPEYIELVSRYQLATENENLLSLAIAEGGRDLGKDAAGLLLKQNGNAHISKTLAGSDTAAANSLIRALGRVGSKESISLLENMITKSNYDTALRRQAASNLGRSWSGEEKVIEMLKGKKVPENLIASAVESVGNAWRGSIREEAASFLPGATAKTERKIPEMNKLLALNANAANGQQVFKRICSVCHQVGNEGADFGPKLTEIGTKLPKESQLEAIVYPSKGISFGYEGWEFTLNDGSAISGIVASKTESEVDLKFPGGSRQKLKASDIKSRKQLKESLMPENLHANLTDQQLADLLEYLDGLKKK
jgi:putative membrane-bound dehydrogenase-like protein